MKKNTIFILFSIVFLNLIYIFAEFLIPLPAVTKTTEICIPKGATFREAVEILSKERLMRDKNLFLLIGRLTGLHRRIKAGYYSIAGAMSPLDILMLLKSGQIIEYEITIVEGDSLFEIGDKLSENNLVDKEKFMELAHDKGFLKSYDINAPSIEGYVFPETYNLPKGIDAEEALGVMINMMREKFVEKFRKRAENIGFTENEVLTMASIIEKEAVIDSERPLISAVYHNRLNKGMPLQADPTAVYGIKSSKEKITMSDLKRKTPYNTYVIKGLPLGPIASPGIKSIMAALYPADVPYIYFVSNNDGSHKFSVTAAEHIKAVKAYREKKTGINSKDGAERDSKGKGKNGSAQNATT
ncbi:MAG: endolytic transglycosylase MltG [Nitrospirae bacterium]|nr:endolytic transglycosylase MltG [Nitrospirota bacterium]